MNAGISGILLNKRFFFTAGLLFLFCIVTHPQTLQFVSYTSQQGLSQNSGYSITQDSQGFLWMGTQDGLNRFDGQSFRTYYKQNIQRGYLASNFIYTLLYDSVRNLLWTGTIDGLTIYKNATDSFVSISTYFPKASALAQTAIRKIYSFTEHEYWVITWNKGVFRLNIKDNTAKQYFSSDSLRNNVVGISCLKDTLLIATKNSLYYWKKDADSVRLLTPGINFPEIKAITHWQNKIWIGTLTGGLFTLSNNPVGGYVKEKIKIPSTQVGNFITDGQNNLWVATRDSGIVIIPPASNKYMHSFHIAYDERSLIKNFTLSIFKDKQNMIWIGTSGGGFSKYHTGLDFFKTWRHVPFKINSLPDNMILTINGNDDNLFIGTQLQGLCVYNKKTEQFKTFNRANTPGLKSNSIYSIEKYDKNLLWVATPTGLAAINYTNGACINYPDKNVPESQKGDFVCKLKNADTLLYSGNFGTIFFDLRTKSWKQFANKIDFLKGKTLRLNYAVEDYNNCIWMATVNEGLVKYNYKKNLLTPVDAVKNISSVIRHILLTENYAWLATDNGVIKFEINLGRVEKIINSSTGLKGNVAYAIQQDETGNIWVSTNHGLCILNQQGSVLQYYDAASGLQSDEFNTACTFNDGGKVIYFGGINGLNLLSAASAPSNNFSPLPVITDIRIANESFQSQKNTSVAGDIALSYKQNFVTIYFAANNFIESNKNIYEYKLEGINTDWVNSGNKGLAQYTNLPPGNYIFKVRSANSSGIWCRDYTALKISITPPWYNTWWFYTLCIAAIASVVYALFRYRIKQISKMQRMQQRISTDLHDDIGASLTSITILSQLSQQQKIDAATRNEYLQKMNEQTTEVTNALRDIVWSINPKNDKLDLILARMKRYATELLESKNIAYSFDANITAADEIADADIRQNLYLIFKEAVNNLVKYADATQAVITIQKNGNQLYLEVKDNGKGFDPENISKGNGLGNMQRRAKAMNAQFSILSAAGTGTTVTATIPL